MDGEIVAKILVNIFRQMFYSAIAKNDKTTKRLKEGQDESDSQVQIDQHTADTSLENNQLIRVETNNNSGEGHNSESENDTKNGKVNVTKGIQNKKNTFNCSANNAPNATVCGCYYNNSRNVTNNYHFYGHHPYEMPILNNYGRRKNSEIFSQLQRTLNSRYKKSYEKIFMFKTDEEFSFHLEKVFIEPVIEQTTLSSCDTNGPKRFILEADYGMGKRTWLRYMAIHIADNGLCPYFDTTNYQLLVMCDVTKLINDLKRNGESFENVLINLVHENNEDFKNFDDTKQLIRQIGDKTILLINGFEFIEDENLREKIKQFFELGIESSNAFKSAVIVFSNSESVEKCSKEFLSHFDSKLSLQGIPKNEYRNLIKKTFEIDDDSAIEFEKRLRQLGLEFVEDMSPRMYVVCYYIYQKYKPESTGEFLKKMLFFEGIEYLKQSKRTERREVLEKVVKLVYRQIGRVLWNMGKRHDYYNTIFEKYNFEADDLRMVQNLGLLFSNNGQSFQVKHQLIYEFFVVYYLNETLAKKNLENQINEFKRWYNSKMHVVTGYSNGEYVLNCIYLSPANNLFTLVFYRMDDSFQVDYFIHRDFREKITILCKNHFTIDVESIDNNVISQVPTIVPIKFENDNYVKELIENRNGDLKISITYPHPRRTDSKYRVTKPRPEVTLNTYSYHVKINGGSNEIVYRVNLLQDDIYSLTQSISGICKMLNKWMRSSVDFAISKQHLRLVFDKLSFGNKVVSIGFGAGISKEGATELREALKDWRIYFINNYQDYNWLININETVVASTDHEDLNLDNIKQRGLTDLSIVLVF